MFARSISVRDFGAKGDGITLDTLAIQSAIDACSAQGGGTVYLPAGRYLTGTITLKDGVTFHLGAQVWLLGSTSLADYPNLGRNEGIHDYCLIYAVDAHHITLTGEGGVDGQGWAFPCGAEGFSTVYESVGPSLQSFTRPMLVHFTNCRDVTISNLTLQNSAMWCCDLDRCLEMRIHGVHLSNRSNQNNDGFDMTNCEDVYISDCHIDCSDDAIALKEGGQRILITNCAVSSRWAAFHIGPEARGVFRNIAISNCVVYDTYGSGIKVAEVEGGVMENISFDNLVMKHVTSPIALRLGGYLGWKNERQESLPIGVLRNIRFSNIQATVADNAYPLPREVPAFPGEVKSCINLCGVPGFYIENITFSGIHVTFPGGGDQEDARRIVPELRDHYPEYFIFGVLPAYGMYIRHARGIILENVTFEVADRDLRPALVCDDVVDLELSNFRAAGNEAQSELVRLTGTHQAYIHGSRPLETVNAFLRVDGPDSTGILLQSNDLRLAHTAIDLSGGTSPGVVIEE